MRSCEWGGGGYSPNYKSMQRGDGDGGEGPWPVDVELRWQQRRDEGESLGAGDGAGGRRSANGVAVNAAPATNLCSAGTPTAVTGTGPWSWRCRGVDGGTNARCSAPMTTAPPPPVNGVCGSAYGTTVSSTPTTIGGGKAVISSNVKVAAASASLGVPLGHKVFQTTAPDGCAPMTAV
jgi:hypothetical protein